MSVVTSKCGIAVGSAEGSFFSLRPSNFSAPKRPLLKRQSGKEDLNVFTLKNFIRLNLMPCRWYTIKASYFI